jgi:hypothetical protein
MAIRTDSSNQTSMGIASVVVHYSTLDKGLVDFHSLARESAFPTTVSLLDILSLNTKSFACVPFQKISFRRCMRALSSFLPLDDDFNPCAESGVNPRKIGFAYLN